MPTGRAVLLFRRLSTGDNRLKNINFNQNTGKDNLTSPVCFHRDLCLTKRLPSFGHINLSSTQLTRNYNDNIVKISGSKESNLVDKPKHTNHLIDEKSPYLLQHAHNPVNWYPWCQEAIDKARKEDKLIFLSIGYSSCHLCQVMEKECFQDETIANIMNELFVSIKVDREERPDIDSVYMLFTQLTTENSSHRWPVSVILMPNLHAITGCFYFPPGHQNLLDILLSISKKWKDNRPYLSDISALSWSTIEKYAKMYDDTPTCVPNDSTFDICARRFVSSYEDETGGFSLPPKFPQASVFNFLFHYYARDKNHVIGKICGEMAVDTLTKVAKGGIHDHVSGGFHRASKDEKWHLPQFEKMLYDQAQLMVAFTDAYLATKDDFFADVVRNIVKYMNRDLKHKNGGYYSGEGADSYPTFENSHKKEGAFYLWEYDELKSLIGDKHIGSNSYFDVFCEYFNVENGGNINSVPNSRKDFANKNILIIRGDKNITMSKFNLTLEQVNEAISHCVNVLYEAQKNRPRLHLDTKILCSWNGLAIAGLAQASQGLGEKSYMDDAIKTAHFIKDHLYNPGTKTLFHCCYKEEDGSVTLSNRPIQGLLDDYAFLIKGLLHLYEASFDLQWLNWARELQDTQNQLFWDTEEGGFFQCAQNSNIVLRLKTDKDGAEPSGNSVSCYNLLRLAVFNDKSAAPEGGEKEREMARTLLTVFSERLKEFPTMLPEMMSALMFHNDSPTQVLISGGCSDPRTLELVRVVRSRLLPGRILAVSDPAAESPAILSRFKSAGDVPTAYVCRRYACSLPVTDVKQLENLLDEPPEKAKTT